ncbi:MAG: 30S ribosomal protein S20 [Armatimonadetes bacterium]|nr:30S ribosomal protein S20 [Armatimonadota bacterium]
MANTKSSKKDLRRTAKRRVRNQEVRASLKTHIKKVKLSATAGKVEETAENLSNALSAIDKAVQRGIIHKNQAARRKSRVAKKANSVKAASEAIANAPVAEKAPAKATAAKPAAKAAAKPAAKPAAAKPAAAKKAPVEKKAAAEKKPAAKKPAPKKKD